MHHLPTINAILNITAAFMLFCGWHAIKKGRRDVHQRFMVAALVASALFLVSYLTYHYLGPGVTRYQKQGLIRFVYFLILGTHTPLAMLIVPFCIMAVYYAFKKEFDKHVHITRWLLPVWMYVSVTGVVIYMMLYVL